MNNGTKQQKIAIFNIFPFHYEMFGYIIHYCYKHNHLLTIYTNSEKDHGYLLFYKYFFHDCSFEYKHITLFNEEKQWFDTIILTTDDDIGYDDTDTELCNKTIRIDHHYTIRRPQITKCIATRPFLENHRTWALPCYPIVSLTDKIKLENTIHIAIIGTTIEKYNTHYINRLEKKGRIVIHNISRDADIKNFEGIDNRFEVNIYKNIEFYKMIEILSYCNYMFVDISSGEQNYETEAMSGSIPLAYQTLTTLIISKQTNQYYKFKHVIEFDKNTQDEILLQDIDLNDVHTERDELIQMFTDIMNQYLLSSSPLDEIQETSLSKMC